MSYQGSTTEKEEEQRGPFASGRVMADILKSESGTQEKKYLHDYLYTLFEKQLRKSGKILSLSAENINENIKQIDNAGFIEVRGKVVFNDINILKSTIENFNKLGTAMAHITNFEAIEAINQQLKTAEKSIKDRNEKARLRQKVKNLTNVEKLARDQGLNLEDNYLKNLAFVLNYAFRDQFVVQMSIERYTFSADCKREDLREDEHLLVRKYSRLAEKEFVLVGTITQSSNRSTDHGEGNETYEPRHLKEVIMSLAENLSVMESEFFGKVVDEIIVDPIALYWEI